jgi:hypothetical protein
VTPQNPSRENSVEKRLHKSRTEEVFASVTFKLDAEGLLNSELYCVEAAKRLIFRPGTGLAGVRRKQPSYIFGLGERSAVKHNSR